MPYARIGISALFRLTHKYRTLKLRKPCIVLEHDTVGSAWTLSLHQGYCLDLP